MTAPLRILITGFFLFLAAGAAAEEPSDKPSPRDLIEQLRQELKRTDNPDSIKYALAVAHRQAETIEDRYRALELLDEIRPTYDTDPDFHWEWARTYEAAARYMDARHSLERVIELRPSDVEARVQIARLLFRRLLYSYDLSQAISIREWLNQALGLDPDHREALFLMSLTLHLARGIPEVDPLNMTYEGRRCAERILANNPSDLDARFLLAIHHLDLNEVNEANVQFYQCLELAPEPIRQALLSSELTGHRGLIDYAKQLEPEQRPALHYAYWKHFDPTPLTTANENQLEFWKRMALAHFFFGDPESGKPGWETDPGKALVRYGPPNVRRFDPGDVTGDSYGMGRFEPTLEFQPPSWSWNYSFRDISFTLKFEDRSLQGKFYADDASAKTMVALERAAPVVFHEASPGAITDLYLTSAGVAYQDSTVRQSVYVGLPPWRDNRKTDWLEESRIEVLVRDSTYTKVKTSMQRITPENFYHPFPGTDILLFSQKYDLPPGKYQVSAFIRDKKSGMHGAFSRPLVVRDYQAEPRLQISDLELALSIAPDIRGPKIKKLGREYLPNPMGLVGDDRNLDVLYELYNLAVEGGSASYFTEYTILPLDYVSGFDYHVARGEASREDLITFAASGLAIGEIQLSSRNYSHVRFPRETVPLKGNRMPKGARVDASGLDPGRYVLVVTVTDGLNQNTAQAQIPFQILTDADLRDLLTYQEPERP